jgi:hypothetical protein
MSGCNQRRMPEQPRARARSHSLTLASIPASSSSPSRAPQTVGCQACRVGGYCLEVRMTTSAVGQGLSRSPGLRPTLAAVPGRPVRGHGGAAAGGGAGLLRPLDQRLCRDRARRRRAGVPRPADLLRGGGAGAAGALVPEAQQILLAGGHKPQPSMVSPDEPAHARLRQPATRAFTVKRVNGLARPSGPPPASCWTRSAMRASSTWSPRWPSRCQPTRSSP